MMGRNLKSLTLFIIRFDKAYQWYMSLNATGWVSFTKIKQILSIERFPEIISQKSGPKTDQSLKAQIIGFIAQSKIYENVSFFDIILTIHVQFDVGV